MNYFNGKREEKRELHKLMLIVAIIGMSLGLLLGMLVPCS